MLPEIAPRRIPTTSRAAPALARIGFTLAVERLMEREFGIKDHGQEARPGKAAWKHMKGRRRLADLLARPAGELLPDVLDGLPLPWHHLQSLGDVFAELRKPGRAGHMHLRLSR